MSKLVTSGFKNHLINELIDSVDEASNNAYYMFTSQHVPRSDDSLPTPIDKQEEFNEVYDNMIFGKRLAGTDVRPLVRNVPWATGTEYVMYDDADDDLLDQDFYVVVDETSYNHVYKCLDNNMNTNSTSQPTFAHVTGSNSVLYQTADGYRWKYLYSFSLAQKNQFGTDTYIPVIANSTVSDAAVSGSIDIIKIDTAGKNYGNYTTSTFVGSDIRIDGNDLLYKISNTTLSTVNGYYTGCMIYISSGTAVGLYKNIDDYYANSTGSYITVNSAFETVPTNGDQYEINPTVEITSDSFQTTNAAARALINASSTNSVYRIEMLNHGVGYTYAVANVIANSVVGVTLAASVRPINGPTEGHGSNPQTELGSKSVIFGVEYANSESSTILTDNSYEKIGILKDPTFANVQVTYYNSNGSFSNNEVIYKIDPVFVTNAASVNTTSGIVQANSGMFDQQFTAGERVYLNSANLTSHMLGVVSSVTNATSMILTTNVSFACTDVAVFMANTSATGTIQSTTNATSMLFDNVVGIFESTDLYIGNTSGAKAQVNVVIRNGVTKGFNTYIQLHKYTGTAISGALTENELIFQGVNAASSTSNATLYSTNTDGGVLTFYSSNQVGSFALTTIEGNTSGAIASVTASYSPEIVYGSGEILYIENIEPVSRANTQTETLKIIFEL